MAFQVLDFDMKDPFDVEEHRLRGHSSRDFEVRIWPRASRPAEWPPKVSFDAESLKLYAERFYGNAERVMRP
jgi:hypothetical protein